MIVKRWTWRMGLVVLGLILLGVTPAGAEAMAKDDIAMQIEKQDSVIYLDDAVLAAALGESHNIGHDEVVIAADSAARLDTYNETFNQTMKDLSRSVFVKEVSPDGATPVVALDPSPPLDPSFVPNPPELISGSGEAVIYALQGPPPSED